MLPGCHTSKTDTPQQTLVGGGGGGGEEWSGGGRLKTLTADVITAVPGYRICCLELRVINL